MSRRSLRSLARTVTCALVATLLAAAAGAPPVRARTVGITIGTLASGANDAITDVAGVRVGSVTRIEGAAGPLVPGVGPVRTGVTVVLPNDDPWTKRVAAATYDLNGNGELTGAHWVDEAGFLEVPVVLTNTLDVGRVDDGVVDWLVRKHPEIGVSDDVPLPVVAECDDQGLNDIVGRHVSPADVVRALDTASGGTVERGSVGAGTGMRAFAFKAGIGTASRRAAAGGAGAAAYTVGVLVNANTGAREELRIDGVAVGRALATVALPTAPKRAALATRGRAADGSIVVTIATDAPLDARQLRQLAKRATLGLARTGITSHVSSGDLLVAFSTTNRYARDPSKPEARTLVNDDTVMDALFAATAEATEAAVDDALFSARTLSGARGLTFFAIPIDRVRSLLGNVKNSLRSVR
ncbi:MAG: P1 family peptidase [Vulcanimicrobiaceae bacterium]